MILYLDLGNITVLAWSEVYISYTGQTEVEQWEEGHLATIYKLTDIDVNALDTPYLKPKGQIFPVVDMIKMPNEIIHITSNKTGKPLPCSYILRHLKVKFYFGPSYQLFYRELQLWQTQHLQCFSCQQDECVLPNSNCWSCSIIWWTTLQYHFKCSQSLAKAAHDCDLFALGCWSQGRSHRHLRSAGSVYWLAYPEDQLGWPRLAFQDGLRH